MCPQFKPLFITLEPVWLRAYLPVACMLDTSGYDADSIIDRQRQLSRFSTTHIQQAADGLGHARIVGLMSLLTLSDSFTPKHAGLSR